jgi:hypothetical protein
LERDVDRPAIEPLLRLMHDDRADVAVTALTAASRFALTEDAWRAVAEAASALLDRQIPDAAVREQLIAVAGSIPARSVRRRLHSIAAYADAPDAEWAYRILAETGDPDVLGRMLRVLEAGPSHECQWTIERLARMPLEGIGVTMSDVPELPIEEPDARFWRSIAIARLGDFDSLESFLFGREEQPSLLWGNPGVAYQRLALVRPLPDALNARILDRFAIAEPPDPDVVRAAGLLVWALTGIADAEGYIVDSPSDEGDATPAVSSPVAEYSDAEVDAARALARDVIEHFEESAARDLPVDALRALPGEEVGPFLSALLRAAHRLAARTEDFLTSNAVVSLIAPLPPTPDIPVVALYRDWASSPRPGVDEGQLAWILARAGATEAIVALAGHEYDNQALDVLAHVGDVLAGTADSPWRGSGPAGGARERRSVLIEDEGWAESAPPPETAAGEEAPPPPRGAGIEPSRAPSRGNGGGGTPPPAGARGGAEPPPHDTGEPGPAQAIRAVLSAEGPKEIDVGQTSNIRVRIEREEGARPLEHAATVTMLSEPVSVIVFLSNEAVQLQTAVLQEVDAPGPGEPRELVFPILATNAGETRAIVHFQQGTTTLAMLSFTMHVVTSGASTETAVVLGTAASRDPFDDGVVRILIEQPTTGKPYYTYYVTSKLLGLVNARYKSPVFEGDGNVEERPKAFAQSLYRRIESEVLERAADARVLETRLERIGTDMCEQLLPESLIRELWKQRDHIQSIEITPVEPYIPWELLRLKHPEEGVDVRHLGEYRLVRTLGGREPARTLGRADWRYVLGEYPNLLYADLPAERTFLTADLPALGVTPSPIPSNVEDILAAMQPAEFDVLHFACHGEASLDRIDESALIVADRLSAQQGKVPVKVFPADLRVNLTPRRPLVFLSACQSGRMAPSLTDFGGWPKVLVEAQAGAMVGTSWAVHEKPAVAFAKAFYSSLLGGETLGEAAGAGRAAARVKGDASWLAYTVYGWSSARMA